MTTANDMEWWGFNVEHGWVVLDRSIPCNRPGIKDDLLFFRCRDAATIVEKREKWNPPLYRFAPNYLRQLTGDEAVEAAAELEAHKAKWPAAQQEMQRERREAAERAEAERLAQEKQRKKAEREAKKQLGLSQAS